MLWLLRHADTQIMHTLITVHDALLRYQDLQW